MPAKKKHNDNAPEDTLDAPAFDEQPAPFSEPAPELSPREKALQGLPPLPPTSWPWPQSTERQSLVVKFTDHDRSEIARKFATIQQMKEGIEEEKKLQAKAHQQRIDSLEAEISRMAASIKQDGENRNVECVWFYEVSGLDSDGQWVANPEYKTLVRTDTLEIVTTRKIDDEERQMSMPLPEGPTDEECEKIIAEAGYKLDHDEQPAEGFSPFFLTPCDVDGMQSIEVEGDDRATALRNAVKALQPAEPSLADDVTKWQEEGAQARTDNLPRARCPYSMGTDAAQQWKTGWDKRDEEIESLAAEISPAE